MSERQQTNLLRRYWLFAGAAFVLGGATLIAQLAFG